MGRIMEIAVLGAWVIQGVVGATLFIGWLRHARGRGARTVITHVALSLSGLGFWLWFVLGGGLVPAWTAFAIITVGNGFGDALLLRRARRRSPDATTTRAAYGAAIGGIFRGAMPPRVAFHALFSGVVYFACLGVCIGASVAAA